MFSFIKGKVFQVKAALTSTETETGLQKGLHQTLKPIFEGHSFFPKSKLDFWRSWDSSRSHYNHEENHGHDSKDFQERHVELDVAINLHLEDVNQGNYYEEYGDPGCGRNAIRPEVHHCDSGCDLRWNNHHPLLSC